MRSSTPGTWFVRNGGGIDGYPDNGTAYLQTDVSGLKFSLLNGGVFGLASVDLAEYSVAFASPVTVRFVGYRSDGSVVTTDFTTDGIIDGTGPLADFQTFHFGSEWSDLSRVEMPLGGWSLDNLGVFIPEPSSGALLLAGALLLWSKLFLARGPS